MRLLLVIFLASFLFVTCSKKKETPPIETKEEASAKTKQKLKTKDQKQVHEEPEEETINRKKYC